jgi:hypothetical protein
VLRRAVRRRVVRRAVVAAFLRLRAISIILHGLTNYYATQ